MSVTTPLGSKDSSAWTLKIFRIIWASEAVSAIGTAIHVVAMPILAIKLLDANAMEVALISASKYLPNALFGILMGGLIDRCNQAKTVVYADIFRALLVALIPILFFCQRLNPTLLICISFLLGSARLVFEMALASLAPFLIPEEKRLSANANLESISSVSNIAGPGFGGLLLTLVNPAIAFFIDAFSFLFSGLLLTRLGKPEHTPPPNVDRQPNLWAGFQELKKQQALLGLILSGAIVNIGFMAVQSIYFLAAFKVFGFNTGLASALLMAYGAGALVGNVLAPRLSSCKLSTVMTSSLLLMATGSLLMSLTYFNVFLNAILVGLGYFLWGACLGICNIFSATYRQKVVSREVMGRVVGVARTIIVGSLPIGALLGGTIGSALGLRAVFAANLGIILLALAVLILLLNNAGDPVAKAEEDVE